MLIILKISCVAWGLDYSQIKRNQDILCVSLFTSAFTFWCATNSKVWLRILLGSKYELDILGFETGLRKISKLSYTQFTPSPLSYVYSYHLQLVLEHGCAFFHLTVKQKRSGAKKYSVSDSYFFEVSFISQRRETT